MYDPAKLPMPKYEEAPEGAPAVAVKRGGEINAYKPVPTEGEIGQALRRQLIHGYYASTSFVDAQIGKVIQSLDLPRRRDLETLNRSFERVAKAVERLERAYLPRQQVSKEAGTTPTRTPIRTPMTTPEQTSSE